MLILEVSEPLGSPSLLVWGAYRFLLKMGMRTPRAVPVANVFLPDPILISGFISAQE